MEIVRARAVRRQGVEGPLFLQSADTFSWRVARDTRGDCVFFGREAGRLCLIHREIGEAALPSACRHFPRQVLHDARGTFISLSHFCPTAASLLLTEGAPSIVDARPPLQLDFEMEGLDARGALPPLLRPDLLCDIDGYDAWERAGIALLAEPGTPYAACLDDLAGATELIRQWTPGSRSLADCVRTAFAKPPRDAAPQWSQQHAIERVARLTSGSADDALRSSGDFDEAWKRQFAIVDCEWFDRGMKNYLAARLFGNWVAYQGRGLRTIVEWLRTCAAVVHHFVLHRGGAGMTLDTAAFVEALRSTDLLLLHVLDSAAFAQDAAASEEFRAA